MSKYGIAITGVEETIKNIQKFTNDLNNRVNKLVQALTDRGVEIANVYVKGISQSIFHNPQTGWYQGSGNLAGSIVGIFDATTHTGIITSNSPYAIYVEYGTGVYGENSSHGEEGWWYYAEGDSHWTKGQPPRQFMYRTYKDLQKEIQQIAKEVFNK